MRWIKELFKPKLKCERIGHDYINEFREIYIHSRNREKFGCEPEPSYWLTTVTLVKQTRLVCDRCGHIQTDWGYHSSKGYDGFTATRSTFDDMDRDFSLVSHGYVQDVSRF